MPGSARRSSTLAKSPPTDNRAPSPKAISSQISLLSTNHPTFAASDSDTLDRSTSNTTMTTTMTTQSSSRELEASGGSAAFNIDPAFDAMDSRSSSLSDIEDAQDERPPSTSPAPSAAKLGGADAEENDSEAETERLDQLTPKPRRGTLGDGMFGADDNNKTPSALSRQIDMDSELDEEETSLPPAEEEEERHVAVFGEEELDDDDEPSEPLADIRAQRKRKRSSSDGSPLSDALDMDEPARKRTHPLEGDADDEVVEDEEDNEAMIDEDAEPAEDSIPKDEPALANGELVADDVGEVPAGGVRPTRPAKGKKGKRKGKKIKGAGIEADKAGDEGAAVPEGETEEAADQEGEGEAEEEDSTVVDEELTKKKNAMDGLLEIEKLFIAFRQKHVAAELAEVTKQQQLLKQMDCIHPDYLAQLACVNARRDEKIRYEDTLKRYKLETTHRNMVSERQQIGSQYMQAVRSLRDSTLDEANKQLYAMQRDRRRWGADDRNSLRLFNPEKKQQVKDQTRYNLEVSILSGVAKFVGFPAAPEISQLAKQDAEDDLRKMGINPRPIQNLVARHGSHVFNEPSASTQNPERTAAAEEFYEQTPWANPQHPAHAQHAHAAFYNPQRQGSATYATPAAQIRIENRINGSGSTVDAMSGPSSSVLAPHLAEQQQQHVQHVDESPIPSFRRVGSGASSVPPPPPVGSRRDFAEPASSRTPGPVKAIPGLPSDAAVTQAFPAGALHVGDPREVYDAPPRIEADGVVVGDDRSIGLLGQRAGPFAVGVGGARIGI